jgi:hypothetical protein
MLVTAEIGILDSRSLCCRLDSTWSKCPEEEARKKLEWCQRRRSECIGEPIENPDIVIQPGEKEGTKSDELGQRKKSDR